MLLANTVNSHQTRSHCYYCCPNAIAHCQFIYNSLHVGFKGRGIGMKAVTVGTHGCASLLLNWATSIFNFVVQIEGQLLGNCFEILAEDAYNYLCLDWLVNETRCSY